MKYFVNINNAEDLKKRFRELSITLHPDRGGNAEDFAAMLAEYQEAAKNVGGGAFTSTIIDEWKEWQSHLVNCTIYSGKSIKVGDHVVCYSLFDKVNNLSEAFYCFLRYKDEERKENAREYGIIESIVFMSDDEAAAFDWFNKLPEGAGEGGSKGPISGAEGEKYVNLLTAIVTRSAMFFINAEGYGYARYFFAAEGFEEMREYKAAAAKLQAEEEEEERKQREAEARAKALYIERCKKWENLMQPLPEVTPRPANFWHLSNEERKAFEAVEDVERRKRHNTARANVLAMARHFFPWVKFSLNTHKGWGGGMTISWTDGPTEAEVLAATDFDLFTVCEVGFDGMNDCTEYYQAQFAEFAKKFGDMDYGKIKLDRVVSIERIREEGEKIRQILPQFAEDESLTSRHCNDESAFTSEDLQKVHEFFGFSEDVKLGNYFAFWGEYKPRSLREFTKVICRFVSFGEPEKVAEFRPEHGKTYKAIKKAMGTNVFGRQLASRVYELVDIYNIAVGDIVGKTYTYEGEKPEFSRLYSSTRKAEQVRREKLAAVGITINGRNEITAINAEVLEALRAEGAEVERQRKAWEEEQKNPQQKKSERRNYRTSEKSEQPQSETNTATASGVEGVEIVELDGGRIAVVGETYEHRETLKSFGGWWNRRAQRWEFRADKAQSVREWVCSLNTSHTEPQSAQDEPQPEPQPEPTIEAKDEPQPEPEPTTEGAKGVNITAELANAFAKVAAIVAAVVMVATSSAAQPEPETETAKGAKIVFSVDDTPELQEIPTGTQTEPQSTPETDTADADRLDALHLARIKAQKLTEENEHTQALFAELEALEACGVDVSDIVRDLHALDAQHVKRGYVTAGEIQMRQFMREFAQHRAAAALTASEYNALFGQEKAA